MAENYTEGYGVKISEIIIHLSYDKILPYIARDLNRDSEELRLAAKGRWCEDGESLVSMYENDVFVAKVIADIANKKDNRMALDITKDANHDVYCITYPVSETYYPWVTERQPARRPYISREDFCRIFTDAIREICDDSAVPEIREQKIYNFS